MEKVRYAIIGTEDNAKSYVQVAMQLPDLFEVTGIFDVTRKKIKQKKSETLPYVDREEELFKRPYDFIIVAVDENITEQVLSLMKDKIPVLLHTSNFLTVDELNQIWIARETYQTKIQVAEMKYLFPSHMTHIKIVERGMIGEVQAVTLSKADDYHCICLLRKYMGLGVEQAVISGKQYQYKVMKTEKGAEVTSSGKCKVESSVIDQERLIATIEFDCGKLAFCDFVRVPCDSRLCAKHVNIQGVCGELDDDTLVHYSSDFVPIKSKFHHVYDTTEGGISKIYFEGEELYTNPFKCKSLTEVGNAYIIVLLKMLEYVQSGKEGYPLAEAFQDMYFAQIFETIAKTGKTIRTAPQIWSDKS